MIKVEKLEAFNFAGAFRGMRNPLESWHNSDSFFGLMDEYGDEDLPIAELYADANHPDIEKDTHTHDSLIDQYDIMLVQNGVLRISNNAVMDTAFIGPRDLWLAQKLILAGTDHRKFMRQIGISMDITAPLYWWKEMDTYKVGTVSNSCSTMHKLATTPITKDCFSFDEYTKTEEEIWSGAQGCASIRTPIEMNYSVIEDCEQLRRKYLETNDIRYWRALIQLLPSSWNQTRTWTANYEILRNICQARSSHKLTEWREFVQFIYDNAPYAQQLIFYKGEQNGRN